MSTIDPLRVLFYSHDTFGLGHIRRTLAIGEAMLARLPGSTALVLTGASAMRTLRLSPGIDFVKLPCVTKIDNGHYEPKFLGVDFDHLRRIREQVIFSTAQAFRPTALVVDNVPAGMQGELTRTLDSLVRRWPRPRIVLTLRDVLDTASKVIDTWARQGTLDSLRRHYDDILVYGTPDVFDLVSEYRLPADIAAKVRYAGYIDRAVDRAAAAAIRASLSPHGGRVVMVTVGGGPHGAALVATYLRGLEANGADVARSLIVLGPDMPEADRAWMRCQYGHRGDVTFLDYCDDMTASMAAADVVVSMGGYNTVCEVLAVGTPAVIVPRVWPRQEQWIRCERLAALGFVHVLHPDGATPTTLWDRIREALAGSRRRPHALDLGGLDVVTRLMGAAPAATVAASA